EVQHLKHKPYNLVLMDWNMPGMNGLEASAEIRKQYDTPIIFLTAYSGESDKVMGVVLSAAAAFFGYSTAKSLGSAEAFILQFINACAIIDRVILP
ncbi:MAG: response regulator, partial [Clostridia bacterium]|nr:response regulator [Clostridia bacterium]